MEEQQPHEQQTDEGFPAATVEFGWAEEQPLAGRRAKAASAKRQKLKAGSFETLGLSTDILRGIKRKGYRLPTPVQRKTLPIILQGQDVVATARTGSGKTAAFVIPMLERLKQHSLRAGARAVLLAPTRELTLQTHKVVRELGRHTNLRTAVLVGGDSMEAQFAELAANPDVILATPGRLMHHLQEVEGMSLRAVEYCVFDEADRLFEMGFAVQLREILARMGTQRQTLLFSATMPTALHEFARAGLREPHVVRLDSESRLSPDLALAFFTVRAEEKVAALLWLIREAIPAGQPTLVFASTRHHVEFLHTLLELQGVPAACVYGAMDQAARKINVGKFRAGKVHVMVVTDVAARGIDIPLLDNVVNFDFPAKPKLFVHRAGRAARAGRTGTAYSLLTQPELPYALDLHLFLSRPLQPAPLQSLQQAAAAADSLDPSVSCYGTVPQVALDDSINQVQELLASRNDLAGLHKSCSNAFALYQRTRPAASNESARRAKAMPQQGMHPLLAKLLPNTSLAGLEAQASLAEIASSLKAYRPAQTALETAIAPARRGEGAGGTGAPGLTAARGPDGGFVEVMQQKRHQHQEAIRASKRGRRLLEADGEAAAPAAQDGEAAAPAAQDGVGSDGAASSADTAAPRSPRPPAGAGREQQRQAAMQACMADEGLAPSGRFRDADFFLSYERTEQNRLQEEGLGMGTGEDLVLDIAGDDQEGLAGQRKAYHWDKRKRRYIQLQPDEQVRAGKRTKTESGARVKDAPSGLYQKWAKSHKRRVAGLGEQEDAAAPDRYSRDLSNRFKKGGRGWQNPEKALKGAGKGDELKTAQQVTKQRKLAAQRKARSQGKRPGRPGTDEAPPHRPGSSTKYGGRSKHAGPMPGKGRSSRVASSGAARKAMSRKGPAKKKGAAGRNR